MIIDLLIAELRRDEGVKYEPYNDTKGIPTVGCGHNLRASPLSPEWVYPLSDNQVDSLLDEDLQDVFAALDQYLPWWRQLDEVRQRVIANMCFNMGIGTLMQFVNTMHAMQTGNYTGAAAGMAASTWAKEVGQRATRLISAMDTGIMPDESSI
jgi:lysozyme